MQSNYQFCYVRIHFSEKFKERTLGTRQLKNTKSHTEVFIRLKHRGFDTYVSEKH